MLGGAKWGATRLGGVALVGQRSKHVALAVPPAQLLLQLPLLPLRLAELGAGLAGAGAGRVQLQLEVGQLSVCTARARGKTGG